MLGPKEESCAAQQVVRLLGCCCQRLSNDSKVLSYASPAKIADPVIHALIDNVRVGPPPTENIAAYRQGATVRLQTTDGRVVINTVMVPHAAASLGLDWADIEAKFSRPGPERPNASGQDRGEPIGDPKLADCR